MKDKLSLMEDESREETQEEVKLRHENIRLSAALFEQAGTCAATVRFNVVLPIDVNWKKKKPSLPQPNDIFGTLHGHAGKDQPYPSLC